MKGPIAWLLTGLVFLCMNPRAAGQSTSPQRGADISFLEEIEAGGGIYRSSGVQSDPMAVLVEHGFTAIRLRLWHTPTGGRNGLAETLATAARAKAAGLGLLLDFHFSDSWADPGQQFVPAAWAGMSYEGLQDSLRTYTARVISALARQGTLPEGVQLGNEIICGLLWDVGRVCDAFQTPTQWQRLAGLLTAAKEGVLSAVPPGDSVAFMIHIDRGGDNGGSRWFFDNLKATGFTFDTIGLSYYPWWHGTLDDLSRNLTDLAGRYGKDIVIVETGYPWTLAWNDGTNNLVGRTDQLHPGYPATVAGQEAFFRELLRRVAATPGGRGKGVYLWEPLAISAPGFGSVMENLALFDFEGEALASWNAFTAPSGTDAEEFEFPTQEGNVAAVYPNPTASTVTITVLAVPSRDAEILDSLGRPVVRLSPAERRGTETVWVWDGRDGAGRTVSPGLYLFAIETSSGRWHGQIVRR